LDVSNTHIFNAPVEAWQAAYHATSLFQKPCDSSDRQSENAIKEINKFFVCFSKEQPSPSALLVYDKLQAYFGRCHVS
jgi:hypothetical protein